MAERPVSFSFVHAADLHLDTPFTGVQAIAPHVASALRDASLAAFDAIVDLAISRSVAFVVFGGDIYDGAERGLRAQLHFRDGLERLAAVGIASFVVHGNHDPLDSGWSAVGDRWPAGVTVFGSDAVTVVPVERDGVRLATVQGISYARRDTTENLARRLSRPDGEGIHIGLLHCNVEGSPGAHANYAPCTVDDLRATHLDYLALGHVHERRVLTGGTSTGDPWIVYPGNSQARSPKASERGAKGAVVVEVRDGVVLEPEFVACDRIRFAELSLSISGLEQLGDLAPELLELATEARREAGDRSLVLRAVLDGRGSIHPDLSRPGVLDELLAHLRDRASATEPFIWWDAVTDASLPEIDISEGRGDFADDLLDVVANFDETALKECLAGLAADAPRQLQRTLDELLHSEGRQAELLASARRLAMNELRGAL